MKKITFLVGLLLLTLTGCEKEPEPIASFSLSNYSPDVGEIISVTNNSIDAFSYLWNDGEGNQTDDFAPMLIYDNPGTYKITLTAFSESGAKQNVTTESVTVVQSYGDVSFWQSGTPAYGVTVVSID